MAQGQSKGVAAISSRSDGIRGDVPPDLFQDIRRIPHQYRGLHQ